MKRTPSRRIEKIQVLVSLISMFISMLVLIVTTTQTFNPVVFGENNSTIVTSAPPQISVSPSIVEFNSDFPKTTCGDYIPPNSPERIEVYPVFATYSETNLEIIRSSFCRDAFRLTGKDGPAILVASFANYERAYSFKLFLEREVENGELLSSLRVGQPVKLR